MSFKKTSLFLTLGALILCLGLAAPASAQKTIVFGDMSWDSAMVHNRIVGFIIEKGMGYKADYTPGGTVPIVTGLARGDIHVDMESWTQNIQEVYDKYTKEGKIIDLGSNFGNSWQGWLVPTYMIKGDQKRGIKATAPDLKTVADMKKYWKLFKDPEDPSKGRFFNGIAGWAVTEANTKRLKEYGLDKYYNDFIPGSDAALAGSISAAYKKGEPWFGYYWAPTWLLGLYDMTPLEEKEGLALDQAEVNILIWSGLPDMAPDVVELLKNYETDMAMNNKILAYMKQNKAEAQDGAVYFLKNYEDLWTKWVPAEVAAKVKAALK